MKYRIIMLLLFLGACGKTERNPELDKLPEPTQTGANTCGCLLNGKALVGANESAMHLGTLILMIKNEDSSRINITVRGEKISSGKTYAIGNLSYAHFGTDICNYFTSDGSGRISIDHFDSLNKVVSGRFSFNASNDSCTAISLTDCRFDFRFLP